MGGRLRTAAAAAAVVGSGLAAWNGYLARRAPPLRNQLGGTERYRPWDGAHVFSTEAGTGSTVLLVHGIYAGSSSFEFRHLFPLLARRHRVVAIDLLGCGVSDMPKRAYAADDYVRQIVDALDALGAPVHAIVGSSLGAAFAIRAAAQRRARVGAVVAICPTGLRGVLDRAPGAQGRALTAFVRTPLIGQAAFNLLASRPSLGWFLRNQAYGDAANVTPDLVEQYWTATHQRGARHVPACFIGGALNCDLRDDLPALRLPFLVLWGERAASPSPVSDAPYYAQSAGGTLATFPHAKLLPHDEDAAAAAASIEAFLDAVEAPT
jgi:pimeloyl-ACP methyl ester carboxylesterase